MLYGTQVVAHAYTANDWYSVTYNGQIGWVSGDYLSKVAAYDSFTVVDAAS